MSSFAIIGSGGHTTEMLKIVREMKRSSDEAIFYFIASTDSTSARLIKEADPDTVNADFMEYDWLSMEFFMQSFRHMMNRVRYLIVGERAHLQTVPRIFRIPKVRKVGQSFIFAVIPAIISFLFAIVLIICIRPKRILMNGPGLCVPIAFAAYFLAFVHIHRASIVYVESLTCVDKLSISGKVVYPIADKFIVHWPCLLENYPRAIHARHIGNACNYNFRGCARSTYALVTVGTTNFDALIRACDTDWFIESLRKNFGIDEVFFQIGDGAYLPRKGHHIRYYTRGPGDIFSQASLIISHGGVGTVLDASDENIPIICIPNEVLQGNHQASFCEALAKEMCIISARIRDFQRVFSSLSRGDLSSKRFVFPAKQICREILKKTQ